MTPPGSRPGPSAPPAAGSTQRACWRPLRRGLPHLHWSLDPRDYHCDDDIAAAARGEELAHHVRPRDIILLHDHRPTILALLDTLLPRLVDAGFDLAGGVDQLGLDRDRS